MSPLPWRWPPPQDCSVEELFAAPGAKNRAAVERRWAWPPPGPQWRCWQAEVGGRVLLFPVESTAAAGTVPHDGACGWNWTVASP